MKIRMDSELLAELITQRGFSLDENGTLTYASGSFSNYRKMVVYQPIQHCSLAHGEKMVLACRVEYESFSEPGYIECDWRVREEGYVELARLRDYLDSKNFKVRRR